MIDLPTKAEVYCANGIAGRSTYIIGKPNKGEITHLVVQSNRPPFHAYLVPVAQIEETTGGQVKLKCTRDELNKMEPFEYEEYIRTELPGYVVWHDVPATPGYTTQPVSTFITVKRRNIPPNELALRCGARVEATDGYVGQVDELLINSGDMRATHLVLRASYLFEERKIKIPVSQIDYISEETIYLELDKQNVNKLPTMPKQSWPRQGLPR